jgi:phosphoribosylamine--glycine ligase
MKIAVIGSGGREHAIAWKLSQDMQPENIYMLPGNGGTLNNVSINPDDFVGIKNFCLKNDVNLIIVGPETPLSEGIVDYFKDTGILVFGPDKKAAQLEASKIWAKQFMKKYGVAAAESWFFRQGENAERVIRDLKGNLVIKYDGLAAGKGVFVCSSIAEANQALIEIKEKYGDSASFLIEKKLNGKEISIIGITDGKDIKLLLSSQDHKPIYDGDKGPNTGGMGAYCPVPFCNEALMENINRSIVQPTLKGIQRENYNFKGVIYFGLMITDEGPKLLEYNIRFGDPETEVILPALKSNLLNLILSCFDGTLGDFEMEFNPGFFVDVVLTSGGYPGNYNKGLEITGIKNLTTDCVIFHAGTKKEGDKIVTTGGRVLNIVVDGGDLKTAITKVYRECQKVNFEGMYYRKDIGIKGFR